MTRKLVLLSVIFVASCGGVKAGRFNGVVASYDAHAWVLPWVDEAIFLPEDLSYDLSLPETVRPNSCILLIATAMDETDEGGRLYLSVRRNNLPLGRARWSKPHAYIVFRAPPSNLLTTGVFVTASGGDRQVRMSAFRLRDRVCGAVGGDEPSDRERRR